jgi:NADPH:quinone reductase-like Zn-dependent oxidoreductase
LRRPHADPQLGKYLGAHVIATTSTEAKAKLAKENGAETVLLTTASSEDNVKEVSLPCSGANPDPPLLRGQGRARRL